MSASKKLSAAMGKALHDARDGGERRLYRWPGGYWMPRARRQQEHAAFGTWANTATIRGLLALGLLREVAAMSRGDPWICELTDKAIQLLETEPSP
jgi:hypothetical protein